MNVRECINKKFYYNPEQFAEILASNPRLIEYYPEALEMNIQNLQKFLKIETSTLKDLIFNYPFLLTSNEKYYKETFRYMQLFLKISHDDFIKISIKFPLILRSDVL